MFSDDLSYFCTTITISALTTLTTIITFSSVLYIKDLYTQILNKTSSCDKESQTNQKVMIHSETQTELYDNDDISSISSISSICNSYIAVEYITHPKTEDSLENLILLAKDQLVIQQNPSNYTWNFGK